MTLRRSADRGHADHGWLKSFHSFSFADYYDPRHMGFGALRVINEDRVAPGMGFGTHGHRDMEIISLRARRRAGAQGQHGQRLGDPSRRRAAHERRARACGTASTTTPPIGTTHFLQIWIEPDTDRHRAGLRGAALRSRGQAWPAAPHRLARRRARVGAYPCRTHGSTRACSTATRSARLELDARRRVYVHVARGEVSVNGQRLAAGDALALQEVGDLSIDQGREAEVLVFDLA